MPDVQSILQQFDLAIIAIELVGIIGFIGVKLKIFLVGRVNGFRHPFVGFIVKGSQAAGSNPFTL